MECHFFRNEKKKKFVKICFYVFNNLSNDPLRKKQTLYVLAIESRIDVGKLTCNFVRNGTLMYMFLFCKGLPQTREVDMVTEAEMTKKLVFVNVCSIG